jgi:Lytic polysaccharide mono-oxygenase, cellulose-degrading
MFLSSSRIIVVALGMCFGLQAFGHIDLDSAPTHKSRYGRNFIKQGPCGKADGERGTNVYTYKPGEKIQIAVDEFIPHPGYFRVSFAKDSDAEFVNPRTVAPINRECMNDPADKCGAADFFNNPGVLADNLDPHKRGFPRTYTWDVTLPDVECENCTLQVMTDAFPIHAPYDPSYDSDDVYYQCIDIRLQR